MNPVIESLRLVILAISSLLVLIFASGCASGAARTRDFATTAATTAVGGYIGARETKDQAKGAAIGAAAGFVVGETLNHLNNTAQKEAYLAGYDKGQSDAVKQQYWIARDNQRPRQSDGYDESLYEISVPAGERDGVFREFTKRVIRVVTPKSSP